MNTFETILAVILSIIAAPLTAFILMLIADAICYVFDFKITITRKE